ncbi:MAG TPA: adenosylcobalamin-dependent ribonucleoside-diphosphate reductase, partial [Arenicellales bacterium]|nr:adenosylcobalamin-dependent ribonucleoside-diphosphate reductase [Arenicellales bacterium]
LPGGRIQAGSGTDRRVTLFNCFVMGRIEDSMDGIFDALKEGAITMQQGGGVGYDFSTLRPAGSRARSVGRISSGPVSFMRIWDTMCATLLSTGSRRGAMMATLRCDHPDIEAFIEAKREKAALRHFNLSVLVTDAFMSAVRNDEPWPLVFPDGDLESAATEATLERRWPGREEPVPCRVLRRVGARDLWRRIMRATYDYAEPGVLFIDRINRLNNLRYREDISATNPCGEIPLPPYGACDLGSINLTRFIEQPFTPASRFDQAAFEETVRVAVRMLDNVVDLSGFPLEKQAAQARGSRRIGLGITGLADALIMLGHGYGQQPSLDFAGEVMRSLCHTAYRASIAIAGEKGAFPFLEPAYLDSGFVRALPEDIRRGIRDRGIRNSHLVAVAPTGTISLLANNISSGVEPVFDFSYRRGIIDGEGASREYELTDYAYRLWREQNADGAPLPEYFVDARRLAPEKHLEMQAAVQPHVDNAISKTINVPEDFDFERFKTLYESAYDQGLKGCTTFRANPITGEVLSPVKESTLCCSIEREAD